MSSSEFECNALDNLLMQCNALDPVLRKKYPDLYSDTSDESVPFVDEFPDIDGGGFDMAIPSQDEVNVSLANGPEDSYAEPDKDDLQIYQLRRKFFNDESIESWEDALDRNSSSYDSRSGTHLAEMSESELFLHAIGKISSGVSDEGYSAIALMERRSAVGVLTRFLPLYTSLENNSSRQKLTQLCQVDLQSVGICEEEAEMLADIQSMIHTTLTIVQEAERFQEIGYRNRQESLQKARESVIRQIRLLN